MRIRRGKPIDSSRLKRSVDKTAAVQAAAEFSLAVPKGRMLDACPVCLGQAHRDLANVYGFLYRECQGCGSAYVANPPASQDLEAVYTSAYYTAANKLLLANDQLIEYRVSNIAEPKVAFVAEHLGSSRKTWLDVGCGVGEILAAARRHGFEVLGLEANPMESEYARKTFGVEVRNQYVTDDALRDKRGQFGVVSLFSVLEHVLDPSRLLGSIANIQLPGDTLVLEVPHYPSLSVASQVTFPDKINRMMHPPLHLFLFSFDALKGLLKSHGYEPCAAWFFGQDFYEFFTTLGLMVPSLAGSALEATMARLMGGFQEVVDQQGLSDEVLVVATRT